MEQERGAPRRGDRVRVAPYPAVWNGGRGRSGQVGTVVGARQRAGRRGVLHVVEVDFGDGAVTDTVFTWYEGETPKLARVAAGHRGPGGIPGAARSPRILPGEPGRQAA